MLSHRHTVSPSVDVEADTPLSPRRRRRRPRRCALCCVLTVLAAVVFASITLATLPEEEQQMDEGAAPLVTTEGIGATLATPWSITGRRSTPRGHRRGTCIVRTR